MLYGLPQKITQQKTAHSRDWKGDPLRLRWAGRSGGNKRGFSDAQFHVGETTRIRWQADTLGGSPTERQEGAGTVLTGSWGMIRKWGVLSFTPYRRSIRAVFRPPIASISVHFPARKLRISAGKRRIVRISKTCAGIRTFLQPVPETDRPDGQTGLVTGPDSG